MKKYYDILGIDQDCNEKEVRKAYKKMALKVHPDSGGSNFLFQQVNEAYNKIIDKLKKKKPKKNKPNTKKPIEKDLDTLFSEFSSNNQNVDMDIENTFFSSPFDNGFFKNFNISQKKGTSNFYSESIKTINTNGKIITKKIINDNGKIYEQIISN